mmetsp:Transcript_11202/g.13680  ORF Transcript_11202/g.13680 Transcript_11202/m.13680 type:complete len:641 (-) Transcript_11202:269-2191(-)
MSSGENWILGVVLGLLGSIAINTGNNIQSLGLQRLQKAENQLEGKKRKVPMINHPKTVPITSPESSPTLATKMSGPQTPQSQSPLSSDPTRFFPAKTSLDTSAGNGLDEEVGTNPMKSATWIVGTIVFVSGSILNFGSYAFAAQSMLASLESIQFVTNLLFGKFMLGATVTKRMLFGTCLTVLGTLIAVQFSSKESLELNTEEMKQLYVNPVYITYLFLKGALLIGLNIAYRVYERHRQNMRPLRYTNIIMPVVYSVWSALFGTQSVVQAKVLAELLSVHSQGSEDIFSSWFTYFTILLWVATVAVWLSRLNGALSKFNPLFIIPLLQCSFIFFAIISGGIFFKEFNAFNGAQWIGFWGGICVMFIGLVLLTPRDISEKGDDCILPQDVTDLIIRLGDIYPDEGRVSNASIIRTPRTPMPTPRMDTFYQDNDNLSADKTDIDQKSIDDYCLHDVPLGIPIRVDLRNEGNIKGAGDGTGHTVRSPCHAKGGILESIDSNILFLAVSADAVVESVKDSMKDAVKEVKETALYTMRNPNILVANAAHTALLTNAISHANIENECEVKRRERIKDGYSLLKSKMQEHATSSGLSNELSSDMIQTIKELKRDIDNDNEKRKRKQSLVPSISRCTPSHYPRTPRAS